MKIARTSLLAAVLGAVLVSPATGSPPVFVTDDGDQREPNTPNTPAKGKKGSVFSGNNVVLSREEMNEVESMLDAFKQENSKSLETSPLPWGHYRFRWRRWCICCARNDENGMLTENKRKEISVELNSEQALKMEMFMDKVTEVTVEKEREEPTDEMVLGCIVPWNPGYRKELVATAETTMTPLFQKPAVDVEPFEYLNGRKKDPVSTFDVPMTKEESNTLVGMLKTFEKENAYLKARGKWFGKPKWITIIRRCFIHPCRFALEDELSSEATNWKTYNVDLTTEQAVQVEKFVDEVGDKFIEEGRGQEPEKENLRGGNERSEGFSRTLFSLIRK